jgi:Fic-DOC domain mobile mystery protein B
MKFFDYPLGATPLDPDEIDGLKLNHISTRAELDRWEQENIQDALAWLRRRRKSDILTKAFICQLHHQMFGKVWKWSGEFRRTNKNIGIEWPYISINLRQLLDDVRVWIEHSTYPPDEIAYRLHHKLVLIHLFPNGNGRHARLITDVLLEQVLNQEAFTWGSENLSSAGNTRKQYIEALGAADDHDYSKLSDFVRL